jgi:hypothetical protein
VVFTERARLRDGAPCGADAAALRVRVRDPERERERGEHVTAIVVRRRELAQLDTRDVGTLWQLDKGVERRDRVAVLGAYRRGQGDAQRLRRLRAISRPQ